MTQKIIASIVFVFLLLALNRLYAAQEPLVQVQKVTRKDSAITVTQTIIATQDDKGIIKTHAPLRIYIPEGFEKVWDIPTNRDMLLIPRGIVIVVDNMVHKNPKPKYVEPEEKTT